MVPSSTTEVTYRPSLPRAFVARGRRLAALAVLCAALSLSSVLAASASLYTDGLGEAPITGGLRPGPIGLNPAPTIQLEGVLPLGIAIPNAAVDAPVETVQIVDGVMQNPTGPWVVSWYEQTAKPGQGGNAVMAGHVDYWDVGPAVLYNLKNVVAGDEIFVVADDGTTVTYEVDWMQTYEMATITPEQIQEIVGPTDGEALTLITCGGEFNAAAGEYLSRTVVRAVGVAIDRGEDTGAAPEVEDDAAEDAAQDEVADDVVESGFEEGGFVTVTEAEVNLRADASTDAEVLAVLPQGSRLTVIGDAVNDGERVWLNVADEDGNEGYVAQEFLQSEE